MTGKTELCPHCDSAVDVVRERRNVPFGARRMALVDDERTRCPSCGEEYYTPEQADQLHARCVERVRLDDGLLTPVDIKRVRMTLGLTQSEFEQLLGTGDKTCVRWETGRVCQSVAADRLIRLIAANRENVRILAGIGGIAMPTLALLGPTDAPAFNLLGNPSASLPPFPEKSYANFLFRGSQESAASLTTTEEHAIMEGSQIAVPRKRVSQRDQLFDIDSVRGIRGH